MASWTLRVKIAGQTVNAWTNGIQRLTNASVTGTTFADGGFGFVARASGTFDNARIGYDKTADNDIDDTTDELVYNESFGGTSVAATHDNNGNLTADAWYKYTYDAWNRLVKVTTKDDPERGNVTIATYTYDATGRRMKKAVTNSGHLDTTELYYYAGQQMIETRNGWEFAKRQFVFGTQYVDEPIRMDADNDGDGDCLDARGSEFYCETELFICILFARKASVLRTFARFLPGSEYGRMLFRPGGSMMCGRYTLRTDRGRLVEAFDTFLWPDEVVARFNVAPTQEVPVVANTGENRVELYRWGLIPSWAKDPKIGNRMINARAESLAEKPAFRVPLRRCRCLVPADGFYEWRFEGKGKPKTPLYVTLASGEPFAFAGLWDEWYDRERGEPVRSFVIVTTGPNDLLKKIHNRMPAILPRQAYDVWLEAGEQKADRLTQLLRPYPAEHMTARVVSRTVNNAKVDSPDCIAPPG